ncbi:MAG: FkbM family methyltransferase [Candidatus Aquilonibacter sp.]|jgi:FkbM family methyltransferase
MTQTISPQDFLALSNLIVEKGIRYFIETNADGKTEGLEMASRLGLRAHVCDTFSAVQLSERYPDADVYDGDSANFLENVLPKLDAPAFFWLSSELERAVVEIESEGKDWHFTMKDDSVQSAPQEAPVPADHCSQRKKVDGVFPDPVEDFDRNWAGPQELKPAVYRSQSEKDTYYAIAVENGYNASVFEATDIVIDIGANIGAFCKRAHLNGSREIYGFEPSAFYMEAAKANVGDLEGVSLHQLAVVRSDDKRKAQYFHDNGMSTMVDEGNPVENVSLDEILADIGPVRFLKIDVEGSEWSILRTCTKLNRVSEIAGEYHLADHYDDKEVSVGALMGFLYDQGFTQAGFVRQADATGGFWAKR